SNPKRLWEFFEAQYGAVNGSIFASLVFVGAAFVVGTVAILALRRANRRYQRKWASVPVLNCPHCREKLIAVCPVIASQRCPACRRQVLANPNAEPVASELTRG